MGNTLTPITEVLSKAAFTGRYIEGAIGLGPGWDYYFDIYRQEIGHHCPGLTPSGKAVFFNKPRVWAAGWQTLRAGFAMDVNPWGPTYIKIRETEYERAHADWRIRDDWSIIMLHLEGMWLPVENDYLFVDQFNVAPFDPEVMEMFVRNYESRQHKLFRYNRKYLLGQEDIAREIMRSGSGLRIMASSVEEIHNDRRPYALRCDYCARIYHTPVDQVTEEPMTAKPCTRPGCEGQMLPFSTICPAASREKD